MPRYFFNIMEGHSKNLVRDIEGALLSGAGEARKEALGLAQDITKHGIHEAPHAWAVIVTDENGDEVLAVPLSGTRARRASVTFDLGSRFVEAAFGRGTIVWLIGAAVLGLIVQAVVTRVQVAQQPANYQTASVETEATIVAVRFTEEASMADVSKFLDAYDASLAGGPRPGNLYHLRIGDTALPPAERANVVRRMGQETIVSFAAAVQ